MLVPPGNRKPVVRWRGCWKGCQVGDVRPPLLRKWAEGDVHPLGVDRLIPKSEPSGHRDVVPRETGDVAGLESADCRASDGEEGIGPGPVVPTLARPLEIGARGPDSWGTQARCGLINRVHMKPHAQEHGPPAFESCTMCSAPLSLPSVSLHRRISP